MKLFPILESMLENHKMFLCLFPGSLDGILEKLMYLLKIVYPYLVPTVCELEQDYVKTFMPYTDEVKYRFIDGLKAELEGVTVLNSPTRSLGKEPCDDADIGGNAVLRHFSGRAGPSKRASMDIKLPPRRGTSVDVELLQRLWKLEDYLKIVVDYVNQEKIRRSVKKRKQEEKVKAHVDSSTHQPIHSLKAVQSLEDVTGVVEVVVACLDVEKTTRQVPGEEAAQNEDLDEERAADVTDVVLETAQTLLNISLLTS